MYHTFFIHSSTDRHLGCFHVLAIVNNAAVSMELHISFQVSVFAFFGSISRSGILDQILILFLIFLRNIHTVFHSGYTSLHSHQQCSKVPFFSHPHQQSLFLMFLIVAFLTGISNMWNHMMVLICICLMILCWTSFHVPIGHLYVFFGKMSIQIFRPFCNCNFFFFCYWVVWVLYIV